MKYFYPRPPRGGRLTLIALVFFAVCVFLSTPSARRATPARCAQPRDARFLSTPSARRATGCAQTRNLRGHHFYPRPPRGGRRVPTADGMGRRNFYPRPPRGGRPRAHGPCRVKGYFYPRPPRGGRLSFVSADRYRARISIHALREEGDRRQLPPANPRKKFLSTPSARRAT